MLWRMKELLIINPPSGPQIEEARTFLGKLGHVFTFIGNLRLNFQE